MSSSEFFAAVRKGDQAEFQRVLRKGVGIAAATEEGEIVPSPLEPSVHLSVARAVAAAAVESGVAREKGLDLERAIPPLSP